jgi:hypothetical protein
MLFSNGDYINPTLLKPVYLEDKSDHSQNTHHETLPGRDTIPKLAKSENHIENNHQTNQFDYDRHSRNIFRVLNNIRANPDYYIHKLSLLIKQIDRNNNTIFLPDNITLQLPSDVNPFDAVAYLQLALPKPPVLWSERIYSICKNELKNEYSPEEILIKSPNLIYSNDKNENKIENVKISANFIIDPELTIMVIFLISEENRQIIYSDNLFEGACACYSYNNEFDKGKTLIYFPQNN